jgi:hypothetical protein
MYSVFPLNKQRKKKNIVNIIHTRTHTHTLCFFCSDSESQHKNVNNLKKMTKEDIGWLQQQQQKRNSEPKPNNKRHNNHK